MMLAALVRWADQTNSNASMDGAMRSGRFVSSGMTESPDGSADTTPLARSATVRCSRPTDAADAPAATICSLNPSSGVTPPPLANPNASAVPTMTCPATCGRAGGGPTSGESSVIGPTLSTTEDTPSVAASCWRMAARCAPLAPLAASLRVTVATPPSMTTAPGETSVVPSGNPVSTTPPDSHPDGPPSRDSATRVRSVPRTGNHRTSGTRNAELGSRKYSGCARNTVSKLVCESTMPSGARLMRHSPSSCSNSNARVWLDRPGCSE